MSAVLCVSTIAPSPEWQTSPLSSDQGPPHNDDLSTKDVTINADGTCGNGWVCEHRWAPVANMAAFRNAVAGTDLNHWSVSHL